MVIAVTGASGFIGTELLAELAERDHKVIALTRGGSAAADSPCCVWKKTDYTDESLQDVLKDAEAVIHLAGARGTAADPELYRVNEEITGSVLCAMSALGIGRMIFASTISVYDDTDLIPWKEDAPLRGRTLYGESKIKCERMIREWAENGEGSGAVVRIAQVLGEGETRRGMMNVFIDTARAGGVLKVTQRSEAARQYLYIKDLVKIFAELAERDTGSITVNAGMPNAYTNLEIAKIVNRVFGNDNPVDYDDKAPESIKPSFMDTGRLAAVLGYHPADMEEALTDMKNTRN